MICRSIVPLIAMVLLIASGVSADEVKIDVNRADIARVNTPMTQTLDKDAAVDAGVVTLTAAGGQPLIAQVDKAGDGVVLRWVEPDLAAGATKSYAIRPAGKPTSTFDFRDGDGSRDLRYGEANIWRDMIKWDEADRENTFKPFRHVFAFDRPGSKTFITKGPGGQYPHHRGIFFGFKASVDGEDLGDFWHGRPKVTQRHVKYLAEEEFAGPVAARVAAVTDWVRDDGKTAVVRDTRTSTTWRIADHHYVFDYDIAVRSLLDKPVKIFADAHHGGFHFRASQQVAETRGANGKPGSAKYVRPTSAKNNGNDIWADCPWVQCAFEVDGRPYAVTIFDHPSNPRPTTFSTRPYGRFGAYFATDVSPAEPLRLKYRVVIRAGSADSANALETASQAFIAQK